MFIKLDLNLTGSVTTTQKRSVRELLEVKQRKHPDALCEQCPLIGAKCAPSDGPENAKIAVVSRSPGYYDVKDKRPFSGPSGKVLDHLLDLYGVKREEILVTNTVLCQTEKPPKAAIQACSHRLRQELRGIDTVICCGPEATNSIIGSGTVGSYRGYRINRDGRICVATNNPALVLRDDSSFPNLVRDFKLALDPTPTPELPQVDWTNDVKEGRRWLGIITKESIPFLSIDIETKGLRGSAPLVALGLSKDGSKSVSFGEAVCSDDYTYRNFIRPIVTAREIRYLYHNGKFDVRNFRSKGVHARVDEDTLLLSWALDERSDEASVHSLDYLLMNELGWPHYEPPEVKAWKAKVRNLEKQLHYDKLSDLPTPDELYEYNALDAGGTARLFPILREKAERDGVYSLYRDHLIRASEAFTKVELAGNYYDVRRGLDILEGEVWPELDNLRKKLQDTVGDIEYNPNSPTQTAVFIYDKWNILPQGIELKDERSTAKPVYEAVNAGRFVVSGMEGIGSDEPGRIRTGDQIRRTREVVSTWGRYFERFKELDKQRSTYLEALVLKAAANDGILYTDFKLHNTVTGRTSSSNPNLQNITRTKDGLPNIRSLFVAGDGEQLVSADYSQAELRSIAALSGDDGLGRIYRDELDLHDIVAERFYGIEYTKEQRVNCKNMNFGVAYLQSADTFQEKHGIPKEEAEKFIEWWWAEFPQVREWTNEIAKLVTTVGEVVSPFGHKRRFHLITKENRNASIREGINFLPQNIAANITLHAMVVLTEELDPSKALVCLQVHDNIVARVKEDHVDETAKIIKQVMLAAPKDSIGWDFPFATSMEIGQNWGDLADYECSI
jgi:uracil-DNA glycosylase family 4